MIQKHKGKGDNVGRDKNIYNNLNPKLIASIAVFSICCILGIVWITQTNRPNLSEKIFRGFDSSTSGFKILIFPFHVMCKDADGTSDVGAFITKRLITLNTDYQLNIQVKYLDGFPIEAEMTEDSIDAYISQYGADMVIFGNYFSDKCSDLNQDEICYNWITNPKWGFIDSIAKNTDFLEFKATTIHNIIKGDLQGKTDFIIYWIAAMSAYNQGDFKKAVLLLEHILYKLKRKDSFVYSFLASCKFYQKDFDNYLVYSDTTLLFADNGIDSIYALQNICSARQYFGQWEPAYKALQTALSTLENVADDSFCQLVLDILNKFVSISVGSEITSKDLLQNTSFLLSEALQRCNSSNIEAEVLLSQVIQVMNNDAIYGDSLLSFIRQILPQIESLVNKKDTTELISYYYYMGMISQLYFQDFLQYESFLLKSFDIHRKLKYNHLSDKDFYLSNFYLDLANVYITLKDVDKAVIYFDSLQAVLENSPRFDHSFRSGFYYSKMTFEAGKCNRHVVKNLALEQLKYITDQFDQASSIDKLAALNAAIIAHNNLGELDKADNYAKQAHEIIIALEEEGVGNIILSLQILQTLSSVCVTRIFQENYEEAESVAKSIFEIAELLPSSYKHTLADVHNLLAHIYNHSKRPLQAQPHIKAALSISNDLPYYFKGTKAAALSNKAYFEYLQGRFDSAIKTETHAYELLKSQNDLDCFLNPFLAESLNNIAKYELKKGLVAKATENNAMAFGLIKDKLSQLHPTFREINDLKKQIERQGRDK
ncbi:MAG: tetratricopeptide repeat protein [Saprospiraceae bacterium]|nr:tetratricopeptide repeat protein [Saprospiraceae bacterium]